MCGRRDDLQVEVSSVRKDLLAAQENITLLETEVHHWNTACTSHVNWGAYNRALVQVCMQHSMLVKWLGNSPLFHLF